MMDPASVVGWVVLGAVVAIFGGAAMRLVSAVGLAKQMSGRLDRIKAHTLVDRSRIAALRERVAPMPARASDLASRSGAAAASLGQSGRAWVRIVRAFAATARMVGAMIRALR